MSYPLQLGPLPRAVWLLLAACVCMVGCGLADYERHIDEQRERVQAFDEENRALGDPLEMPAAAGKAPGDLAALNVFLRPPKGVAAKPESRAEGPNGLLLYRSPGSSCVAVLLAGRAPEASRQEKEKAPSNLIEEFRADVRTALIEFCKTAFQQEMDWRPAPPTRVEIRRALPSAEDLRPSRFDRYIYPNEADSAAPWRLELYCYQRGGQVAIAYLLSADSAENPQVRRAVELSLKSLDLGDDGARKRSAYAARKRGK